MFFWSDSLKYFRFKNLTGLIYLCHLLLLQLYNGPNQQAPLIGTFCGSQSPPASVTSSSSLTVVFRTDSSVSQSGFQMMWYQNGKKPEQQEPHSKLGHSQFSSTFPDFFFLTYLRVSKAPDGTNSPAEAR